MWKHTKHPEAGSKLEASLDYGMRMGVDVETQRSEVFQSKLEEISVSEQSDMIPGSSRHFPSRLVS